MTDDSAGTAGLCRSRDDLVRMANLRDIGGVVATNGRCMRRGLVFRSAALTDLTGAQIDMVRALGIRTIIDLRRNGERAACPTPWEMLGCTEYWARDYDYSDADHRNRLQRSDYSAGDGYADMIALYAALPYDLSEAYAKLFQAIARGEGAVLFHCAVGKDRTGVAAALILEAAGVARADILTDYMATDAFDLEGSPHARSWPKRSVKRQKAIAPLLGVDPAYLNAMFDALATRSNTIDGYLHTTLGLDAAEREAIRRTLLLAG